MKVTLKKFADSPYKLIEKAPLIILVNREPRYAIIPYVVYKNKVDNDSTGDIHENTYSHHIEIKAPKVHGRIWRLLFE